MKRLLMITVLGLSILCSTTGASAAETEVLLDSDAMLSIQQTDGTGSTSANAAKLKGFSTVKEDYIYAQAKTFNGDGSLIKTNSQSDK
ncbi:hypothetical protein [Peribacillus simplex]|uniref:hypothetical protein n=1 Tax=Peribacillus simplex TaxID=1478 RepID=UPI003D273F0A